MDPDDLLDAYRQGMSPEAENPEAVFTHTLRRTGWTPEARGDLQRTIEGVR